MTSYASTIEDWAECDTIGLAAPTLRMIERAADAASVPGMHDQRVEIMVAAAFGGFGDTTGCDDFGYSAAWLDLADHIDVTGWDLPDGVDYWGVGAYCATWRDVAGCRYVLCHWDANGSRAAVGYATRADLMDAYRSIESEYAAWLDLRDDDMEA